MLNTPLLTVREVAENHLQVSERSVWTYISDGRLRATRLGPRTTRIRPADLEAFLEASAGRVAV